MPLQRTRINSWFAWNAETPLRYLWAPSGCGKTTAAVLYARKSSIPTLYIRVSPSGSVEDFLESFGAAKGVVHDSESSLYKAFAHDDRVEIIVDDIDLCDEELKDLLNRLPDTLPHGITLIYLSQSQDALDIVRFVSSGMAVVANSSLLAFDLQEIVEYCEALSVAATATDVAHIMHATDGWAFAVTGAIREVAAAGKPLRGAYTKWADGHQMVLAEIASRSLIGLASQEREIAERLYAGQTVSRGALLTRLQSSRLVWCPERSECRLMRPFLAAAKKSLSSGAGFPTTNAAMASLQMFGECEMIIDGYRVEWSRRRDRQIIEFLALRPGGTASRAEVIETFWPDADPHLGSQSLRTACSTIRRAIAQRVGYDRVEHYFSVGRDLTLHFENVVTTPSRFNRHIQSADEAFQRNDAAVARAHYLAALRLYRAPLLNSEGAPAQWFIEEAASTAAAAERAQERSSHRRGLVSSADRLPWIRVGMMASAVEV